MRGIEGRLGPAQPRVINPSLSNLSVDHFAISLALVFPGHQYMLSCILGCECTVRPSEIYVDT